MLRFRPTRIFIGSTLVAVLVGAGLFMATSFLLLPTPVLADEPVPATIYLPWVARSLSTPPASYSLADTYTLFGYGDTPEQARQGAEYQLWGPEITLGTYRTKQRPPIPLSPKYLLMRSRAYVQIAPGIQLGDTATLYLERYRVSGPTPLPSDVRVSIYRCPSARPTNDPRHWHDEVLKLGEVMQEVSPVQQLIVIPLDLTAVSLAPGEELCLEARGAENLTQELELSYDAAMSRLEITRAPH